MSIRGYTPQWFFADAARLSGNRRASWLAILLAFAVALSGCSSGQRRPPPIESSTGSVIVDYALSLQGTPYRYGGDTPEEGFDCSGLVNFVYRQHGVRLPRTAQDMAIRLPSLPFAQRQPGDLLLFDVAGRPFSHVGIYAGRDTFVHAPSTRTGRVIRSSLDPYWRRFLAGVRRPFRFDQLANQP